VVVDVQPWRSPFSEVAGASLDLALEDKAVIFLTMASLCAATDLAGFFRAASLANLEAERMMTVHGADRPVLLCWHEGEVFALDNRCPHMGFPLSKGSLDHGLLTCPWHHARFDLRSGCTFDLWADDTPMFEVCVEGDDIWVSKLPVQRADALVHFARLRRGLEENIGLVQAKSIVALLAEGEGAKSVIGEIAKFGARHHRVWGDGMTMLSLVAWLGPCLGESTLVYALAAAARRVAGNCAGEPMRHSPGRLNGESYEQERLSEWMFHWAKVRHDDAAERTLLTAVGCGLTREALNCMVFGPIQERIYADRGHALDLSNKAFELLEFIGWEYAAEVLPLIVEHLTQSRSEEEQGTWRAPVDLVELIQSAEGALRKNPSKPRRGTACPPDFSRQLLGEDPQAIIRAIVEAVNQGVPPVDIARHLTLPAAWRLARFPESNDIEDWFAPMHTFSFCNALHHVLARGQTEVELVRGLFHAAMSIYVDRFLNIPRAQLPSEQSLENLPTAADELCETILSALDQRQGWSEVPRLALRYLRLGHPEAKLIDTLTFATVREDLDFHSLQVLEAGVTQAAEWPPASAERELFYVAICRHLAAHCPTRRSSSQSVAVALRLQKGEEVYAE
jgi:nitrite reductase/ring-hydroxylating ferredoxin subunit